MSQNGTNGPVTQNEIEELRLLALKAAENAYAPYSEFRVGAALVLDNGKIIVGCNVENASYRLTTCAEQAAIVSAVAQYGPDIRIRVIVIANLNNSVSQPCGACRQTIREFSDPNTEVYFPSSEGSLKRSTIEELLPYAFALKD